MSYFPFFADIEGKKCIVIGGGRVALRKVEKLLSFGTEMTVIGTKICTEIKNISQVKCFERAFVDSDIDYADFVISATDDEVLSQHIFEICRERKIPVNTVDDKEKCTFIFPALAVKNDVTVGISTGGKSPLAARKIKEHLYEILDDNFIGAVDFLGELRDKIKEEISEESRRKICFEKLWDLYFSSNGKPDEFHINSVIKEVNSDEN